MDLNELDKQLAELQLIANGELKNSMGANKKIGPAVPPKPKKQQPLVPQSYSLKKQTEPLYASRLQTAVPQQAQMYSNLPPSGPPPGSANSASQNMYANLPRASPQPNSYIYTPQGYTKPPENTYSNVQRNADGLIYSNLMHPQPGNIGNTVYSNVPNNAVYANGDDLPPPPPPVPMLPPLSVPFTVNTNFPPPPDELPPPPSPVSSSYSELRRATEPGPGDYNNYMGSQSSTYESIYEPINPRPPSQMSSRSNYSLYAPYVSGGSTMSGPSQSASRAGGNEQVVDTLTDLLVQGMDNEVENGDCFGVCAKCKESVVGVSSGCTAMDQIWHTACFACHHCAINLQGKPFYCMDGKPYCEDDYLNTLEKCCVCTKPILDRILRATGKPYHPMCFKCVICGKSLDGIPFTVDATNQIHCIEDFHKKFAPRCCVCKLPIMPEPNRDETVRVVALDRSFHINCYKCEDCGLVLSSESEGRGCYPLDDHVLCKSCNAKRVQQLTNHMTTEL